MNQVRGDNPYPELTKLSASVRLSLTNFGQTLVKINREICFIATLFCRQKTLIIFSYELSQTFICTK
jgi:hypothetical protein